MATSRTDSASQSGFTLLEMIAVMVILAILAAAMTRGLSRARERAWRTQARETCRQLCAAWNVYLLDERSFPSSVSGTGLDATEDNLKELLGKGATNRVYIEFTAQEQERKAITDHWGQYIKFSLDTDYDNLIDNPAPDEESTTGYGESKLRASAVAWSLGNPKYAKRKDNAIVAWQ